MAQRIWPITAIQRMRKIHSALMISRFWSSFPPMALMLW
jgi:hypothetical protein